MELPPIDKITSVKEINEWVERWEEECLHVNPKDPINLYDEDGFLKDPSVRETHSKIEYVTKMLCKIKNLNHKINGVGNVFYTFPTYEEIKQWKSEQIDLYNELSDIVQTPKSFDWCNTASSPKTHHITDFSHMKSFTPTIDFDMSKLYHFLIDDGVIKNVDKKLFSDCISHAHINELWEDGTKSKIKLVVHRLKNNYNDEWFTVLCGNLNTTKQDMGKFNVPKRKEFERNLPI